MLSRLKFKIKGLFEEIYNKRLPDYVFIRNGVTFADLQCAGLQSIIPIVNKLRENGRSDEYIRSHVFVFCEDELDLNSLQFDFSNVPVTFDIYNDNINMKFDVVVGNPPYQENSDDGKSKGGGKNVIRGYGAFVKHGLELLKKNGVLIYIIPQGWQVSTNALWKLLTKEFSLDYIDNDNEYYQKFFNGVGSTFCVIKASNKKYTNSTFVESFGILDLQSVPTLPDSGNSELLKNVLNTFSKEGKKLKFKTDSKFHFQKKSTKENVSTVNDDVYVYPIKHTSSKTFYSIIPHPAQNVMKVIVSDSGYLSPLFDHGQYGVTQHSPYMIVENEEEGNKIVDFLNSDNIKNLLQMTKKSGFFNMTVINSLSYE
jgi:hypothetical protein